MRKLPTLLFALGLSAGTVASLPCNCAKDPIATSSAAGGSYETCGDRYNALLTDAKAALARGDRDAAIRRLLAARSQLRTCEERDHDNAAGVVALALNSVLSGNCRD